MAFIRKTPEPDGRPVGPNDDKEDPAVCAYGPAKGNRGRCSVS